MAIKMREYIWVNISKIKKAIQFRIAFFSSYIKKEVAFSDNLRAHRLIWIIYANVNVLFWFN